MDIYFIDYLGKSFEHEYYHLVMDSKKITIKTRADYPSEVMSKAKFIVNKGGVVLDRTQMNRKKEL